MTCSELVFLLGSLVEGKAQLFGVVGQNLGFLLLVGKRNHMEKSNTGGWFIVS
jgi:hypothetical protein